MGILAGEPSKDAVRQLQAGLLLEAGPKGEPLLVLVMHGKPAITLHGSWACFEKARSLYAAQPLLVVSCLAIVTAVLCCCKALHLGTRVAKMVAA